MVKQSLIGPAGSGQRLITCLLGFGPGTEDKSSNELVRMTEDIQGLTLFYQCLKNRLENVLYFRANERGGKI